MDLKQTVLIIYHRFVFDRAALQPLKGPLEEFWRMQMERLSMFYATVNAPQSNTRTFFIPTVESTIVSAETYNASVVIGMVLPLVL
jgi:hypothetical protein